MSNIRESNFYVNKLLIKFVVKNEMSSVNLCGRPTNGGSNVVKFLFNANSKFLRQFPRAELSPEAGNMQ